MEQHVGLDVKARARHHIFAQTQRRVRPWPDASHRA
jgi:hypothetical protein